MFVRVLCLLAVCSSVSALLGIGAMQSIKAVGILKCNGELYKGALVKLYDNEPIIDEKLGSMRTLADGSYMVSGSTREITDIDPKINIYHSCDKSATPCERKFSITIPDEYISSGEIAEKVYDAGVLELSGTYSGESTDCIH